MRRLFVPSAFLLGVAEREADYSRTAQDSVACTNSPLVSSANMNDISLEKLAISSARLRVVFSFSGPQYFLISSIFFDGLSTGTNIRAYRGYQPDPLNTSQRCKHPTLNYGRNIRQSCPDLLPLREPGLDILPASVG